MTRAVARGAHREGQQKVYSRLLFVSPASPAKVLDDVSTRVNAHPTAPALVDGLYLALQNDESLVYGSKIDNAFAYQFHTAVDGTGSKRSGSITSWKEVDGLVAGRDQMAQLQQRISEAITSTVG